jgi:hypothetical protein
MAGSRRGTPWQQRHREEMQRQIARLRGDQLARAWGEWLGRIPWDVFITLTFAPRRMHKVSRDFAGKETLMWLRTAEYAHRRPLAWAYAVERGRGGRWHSHVLVANAGSVNWPTLQSVWNERNGHAHVALVYEAQGVSMYTTKAIEDAEVVVSDALTVVLFSDLAQHVVVPLTPRPS